MICHCVPKTKINIKSCVPIFNFGDQQDAYCFVVVFVFELMRLSAINMDIHLWTCWSTGWLLHDTSGWFTWCSDIFKAKLMAVLTKLNFCLELSWKVEIMMIFFWNLTLRSCKTQKGRTVFQSFQVRAVSYFYDTCFGLTPQTRLRRKNPFLPTFQLPSEHSKWLNFPTSHSCWVSCWTDFMKFNQPRQKQATRWLVPVPCTCRWLETMSGT